MVEWYTRAARPILKHYPFQRGRWRLTGWLMQSPKELPEGVVVESRYRTRFRVHADGMFRELYLFGDYEPVHTKVFRELIAEGDTVFDIGANFGWYTAAFSKWVGTTGRVHAFEPVPHIIEQTRETIALNRIEPVVQLNQHALGEEVGDFQIYTFAGLPHGYASSTDLGRDDAQSHSCQVSTLDLYCQESGTPRVDLMKIDVEGHELSVLRGGQGLLSRPDGPMIVFETNRECLGARGIRAVALQDALREFGYTDFWSIRQDNRLERITGAIPDEDCDYLAVKPAQVARAEAALRRTHIRFR